IPYADYDDLWSWNGDSWSDVTPAGVRPTGRTRAMMASDPESHTTVLFGGRHDDVDLDDTWLFKDGAWEEIHPNPSPQARSNAAVAYDAGLGKILIFGGESKMTAMGPADTLGDLWAFDAASSTWSPVEPTNPPSPRSGAKMAYDSDREVIVLYG